MKGQDVKQKGVYKGKEIFGAKGSKQNFQKIRVRIETL